MTNKGELYDYSLTAGQVRAVKMDGTVWNQDQVLVLVDVVDEAKKEWIESTDKAVVDINGTNELEVLKAYAQKKEGWFKKYFGSLNANQGVEEKSP